MMAILGFFGSSIGRYLLIGVGGLFLLSWFASDLKAPLHAEISALREASAHKDRMIEADAERKLADLAERARLETEFRKVLNETDQSSACRLSSDELDKLRKL